MSKYLPLITVLSACLTCLGADTIKSAPETPRNTAAALPGPQPTQRAASAFMVYPEGTAPELIGKKIAEELVARPKIGGHYAEACTTQGALEFSGLTGDTALQQALVTRYVPNLDSTVAQKVKSKAGHLVDNHAYAIVPLEMYIQTGNAAYLKPGMDLVNSQWKAPLLPNGLTQQTRWWIDDMYMVGALLNCAYRATQDPIHAERSGLFLSSYIAKLQQPGGLFFHGPTFPTYWGRGNGWVAVSTADALRIIPENSPYRAPLLAGYRKMMAALLSFQGANGLWHQVIDNPDSYAETSCTAMFTYAFIVGVKNGWLDQATYTPAAEKGWLGLVKHLNAKGKLSEICIGTGQSQDVTYYLTRPRATGDFHGQAPLLWCANALLRTP